MELGFIHATKVKFAVTASRKRPSSALANDVIIRQAATSLLAEVGLTGVSLGSVARRAGLSHTALAKRFAHRDELLCELWDQSGSQFLNEIVVWAQLQLEKQVVTTEPVSGLALLMRQSQRSLCFGELLAVSATNSSLRKRVQASFTQHFESTIDNDPVKATQLIFLLALIIGTQMEIRSSNVSLKRVIPVLEKFVSTILEPAAVANIPEVDSSHMKYRPFDTGNSARDQLLTSCLRTISQLGFEDTTTKLIASEASVSEGMLFSMFSSKTELFYEATTIQSHLGFSANLRFILEHNEKFGPGMTSAILMREWQSPDLSEHRAVLLEQTRLCWHDPLLRRMIEKSKRELLADQQLPHFDQTLTDDEKAARLIELAIPIGIYVIGVTIPQAAQLPYSVVANKLP